MNSDAMKAVKRGAKLLDAVADGWRDKVDVKTLDLADGDLCVLGQIYGSYPSGLVQIGFKPWGDNPSEFGFAMSLSLSNQSLDEAWKEFLTPAFAAGDLFVSFDQCIDRIASVVEVEGTMQYITERGDETGRFRSRYPFADGIRYTVRSEEWMKVRDKFSPFPYAQHDVLRSSDLYFLVQNRELIWSLTDGFALPYDELLERGHKFELVTTRSGVQYSEISR